ncbi:MAG: FAD-dependent oxidoreductase [Cyanobacteria bacterium J06573_11]
MPVDYDLVILGGTLEGRIAARAAVGYGARVALVEPPGLFAQRQQASYLLCALQQQADGQRQQAVSSLFYQSAFPRAERQFASQSLGNAALSLNWEAVLEWSRIASETQLPDLALTALGAAGVDVIAAMPEGLSRRLTVTVAQRQLTARAVLAAYGSVPYPIFEAGVGALARPALTGIESLLQAKALPESLWIWGGSPEAVMWADALTALGVKVTLVADRLLRYEDSEVRGYVRSQLIISGIQIVTSAEVINRASKSNLQTIAETSLFLERRKPAFVLPDSVQRPVVQYPDADYPRQGRTYLLSNKYLQLAHPRLFACGSLLHGRVVHRAIAQQEALVAVKNALFWPNQSVDYGLIPEGYGHFARVGVTPKFAQEGSVPYSADRDYRVWTASSSNSTDLSRLSPQPALCKLICKRDKLQSIHLLGNGANELIEPLALMIGRPVNDLLSAVERLPGLSTAQSLSGLVRTAAQKATRSRWQPGNWRRDWAENWFNWRRSR